MRTHVTYYQSLQDNETQRKHLQWLGLKLEQHQNIKNIPKLIETMLQESERYEIVERPNHVILKNKTSGLPVLHITSVKDVKDGNTSNSSSQKTDTGDAE